MRRCGRWWGRGLLVWACLLAACRPAGSNGPPDAGVIFLPQESITEVRLLTVESGPNLSGTLSAERSATLRAEASGTLTTLVERGQAVEEGAVLARIDSPSVESQLQAAQSALGAARTAVELAQLEEQRARTLFEAGAIARQSLDQARQARIAAQAGLAEAQARLSAMREQSQRTDIQAPFQGVVSERMVSSGDVVAPGTPLFTVVDPRRLVLEASVPAEQAFRIQVGDRVDFQVSGFPERLFEGVVDRVNPAVDPATRQVRLYASLGNPSGQLPVGVFATGRVTTAARRSLSVPLDAVDLRGAQPVVVRLNQGRTQRVQVELGLRDEQQEVVEVRSGLSLGDRILRGPARATAEGILIQLQPPTSSPGEPGPLG